MIEVKSYGVRDMFNFWVRSKRKNRPYLTVKYPARNKNTELWYDVKSELEYLEKVNLEMDSEILRLEQEDSSIDVFTKTTHRIYELKKEIYTNQEKIKHLSKQDRNKQIMLLDFDTFKKVIYAYNKEAIQKMIQGEMLNLNENLGYIYVLKVNRPSKNIDWEESNKYKKELIARGETPKDKDHPDGKNWLVYYEDNFYFRWAWKKRGRACRIKNNTVYGFYPTSSSSKRVPGTKKLLVDANRKNPALHLNYISR